MFAGSPWYALATSLLKWVLGFHTATFFQDEFCSLITPQIGIDIETQIEEGELFDFDVECEPVLEAWGLRLSGDVNRADLRTFMCCWIYESSTELRVACLYRNMQL